MNCWRIRHNLVAPFLDGVLDDDEQQAIAEHLDECSECSALVKGVASLPPLPFNELDPELVAPIFADFERDLAERIQDSLSVIADSQGAQWEETAASPSRAGLRALFTGNTGRSLSPTLVGAYVAVLAILTGGLAWHYVKVETLEASLAEHQEEIGGLQELLDLESQRTTRALAGLPALTLEQLGAESTKTLADFPARTPQPLEAASAGALARLPDLGLSNPFPAFGPSNASGALSVPGIPSRMPVSALQGSDSRQPPPPIQQVSFGSLDGIQLRR